MNDKKTVVLDTRESDSEFISYLYDSSKKLGYNVSVKPLIFGDIMCGDCVVERKTIDDFAQSITSERMWNQLFTMGENKDYKSTIIISGYLESLDYRNTDKIPQIYGAISKIIRVGIPVLWVKDDKMLTTIVLSMFEKSEEIDVPIKKVEKNKKLSIFMALPNIGRKKAGKLISVFGTIECLCLASEKDLKEVLNEKDSHEVYEALRK